MNLISKLQYRYHDIKCKMRFVYFSDSPFTAPNARQQIKMMAA